MQTRRRKIDMDIEVAGEISMVFFHSDFARGGVLEYYRHVPLIILANRDFPLFSTFVCAFQSNRL